MLKGSKKYLSHFEITYLPHFYITILGAADSRNSQHFCCPKIIKIKAENTYNNGISSIKNIKLYILLAILQKTARPDVPWISHRAGGCCRRRQGLHWTPYGGANGKDGL